LGKVKQAAKYLTKMSHNTELGRRKTGSFLEDCCGLQELLRGISDLRECGLVRVREA